jgi:hypothetical protein
VSNQLCRHIRRSAHSGPSATNVTRGASGLDPDRLAPVRVARATVHAHVECLLGHRRGPACASGSTERVGSEQRPRSWSCPQTSSRSRWSRRRCHADIARAAVTR